MTRTLRSPGSTLKPFIYGLAFEQGMIAQQTIIEDRPADFFGYRPKNFDMSYQGDVTIRQALQMSLNVPAVKLLEAVGPTRLTSRFRRAGVNPKLPQGEARDWRLRLAARASACAISSSSMPRSPIAGFPGATRRRRPR